MDMNLKVKDVVDAWPSLRTLAAMKLKMQPSFWLGRQIKKLKLTYESYEDSRSDLVRELGELVNKDGQPAEDGTEWRVMSKNEKEFADRVKELLDADVTEGIEPRPVSYLALVELEPAIIANTWFLWTDDEPPAPTAPEPEAKEARK